MGRILLGVVLGLVLVPVMVFGWLMLGRFPVAVNDTPLPREGLLTAVPLNARISREMVKTPPIQPNETNLVSAAHIYGEQCAVCHGFHGKPSPFAAHMFPAAPPLWERQHNGSAVGVSNDAPGKIYWKISNGIRLTGMPSYRETLSETEMWQVATLLANADKPLPPAALAILSGINLPVGRVLTELPANR